MRRGRPANGKPTTSSLKGRAGMTRAKYRARRALRLFTTAACCTTRPNYLAARDIACLETMISPDGLKGRLSCTNTATRCASATSGFETWASTIKPRRKKVFNAEAPRRRVGMYGYAECFLIDEQECGAPQETPSPA